MPLVAISSAEAVPAFAPLEAPARAVILEAVRREVEPTGRGHRDGDVVTILRYAHVALALT